MCVYALRQWNAAAVLDPANWRKFKAYGGNFDDALAFIFSYVLLPCATKPEADTVIVLDDDSEATSKKALDEAVAAIKARVPASVFVDAGQFKADNAADIARVTAKYNASRAATRVAKSGNVLPEDDGFGELQALLEVEFGQLQELVKATAASAGDEYGDPLADKGAAARYEFWPSKKTSWPVLYFCARQLLCAKWTSSENERVHSASGRFLSKLRSSMTARNLEVSYVAVKKLASTAIIEGKSLAEIDLGDVDGYLDELEGTSEDVA